MKRIAFLGPEGTVSEESARWFFRGQQHEYVNFKHISEVFLATAQGDTDLSVVPIENAIDGSVSLHVDWLIHEVNLPIQAEWVYPSVQNLIGYKEHLQVGDEGGVSFAAIQKVLSYPVAIAQCRNFLRSHLPNADLVNVSSTAEGVRLVHENGVDGELGAAAAIGTKLAAQKYGLDVLAANITDHHNNYTRFVLVGYHPPELKPTDTYKTTLIVTLPEDYPGALHQVLHAFAWRRLNLSKIESRPTKTGLGKYYFYIDVEASLDSVLLPAAIEEIQALGCQVRILGSYPSYAYEPEMAEQER